MIRLFIKFSLSILLLILCSRWMFYHLLDHLVFDDRQRVVSGLTDVQIGGLKLIAAEMAAADPALREQYWETIRQQIHWPIEVRPLTELTSRDQSRLRETQGFIYQYRDDMIDYLGVPLEQDSYLRLGPMGDKAPQVIEQETANWLPMIVRQLASTSDVERLLKDISRVGNWSLGLRSRDAIPLQARQRIDSGDLSVLFVSQGDYFVVTPLEQRTELLCLGPLTKVKQKASRVLTATLVIAFGLMVAATSWLVYRVATRFARIEAAARKIADGRLEVRVDESIAGESRVLAHAFNLMATRTESSLRAKDEMLQMISHELRTPLARLRFAVEILENSPDPETRHSRLTMIRQSIDNLDSIVDEVLYYVRNDDAFFSKYHECIDIRASIEPMIHGILEERPELKFEWLVADHPPTVDVYADRMSFQRVIGNLLSNAARYAKSTVRIHVYAAPTSAPHEASHGRGTNQMGIDVEDDGPGITESKREEVFSPFVRLSTPSARSESSQSPPVKDRSESSFEDHDRLQTDAVPHAGLGLGLAIVARTLKQYGGAAWIEQGSLGGCLVRTRWPVSPADE